MRASWMILAGLGGALGVGGAAITDHLLAGDAHAAGLLGTAASMAIYHSLALLCLAAISGRIELAAHHLSAWLLGCAAVLFVAGTLLFSGSLTVLALTGLRVPGAAPVGGTCLILAWLTLAAAGAALLRSSAPASPGEQPDDRRR